jgi:hypothetical protein
VKRELLDGVRAEPDRLDRWIDALDASIRRRTEVAEQLGIALPFELLRRRFGLAQARAAVRAAAPAVRARAARRLRASGMLFALETGGAFNRYDTRSSHTERVDPTSRSSWRLSGGERSDAERARVRCMPDVPLNRCAATHRPHGVPRGTLD